MTIGYIITDGERVFSLDERDGCLYSHRYATVFHHHKQAKRAIERTRRMCDRMNYDWFKGRQWIILPVQFNKSLRRAAQ